MLKRIFLYTASILIVAYLVAATTFLNARTDNQACQNLELLITDTVHSGFVDKKEITSILQKNGIRPIGKSKYEVSTKNLEEVLNNHALLDRVECYWTHSGRLFVEISQRIPILRVMNNQQQDYYIDNKGEIMPSGIRCVAHKPIVSGTVEKSFAVNELYNFGVFLQNNSFWNAQIEQINVLPGKYVELVPRVGNHIIYLGRLENYDKKLKRLKTFYQKGLNEIGWDKYSRINVEIDNQIVCTRRDN